MKSTGWEIRHWNKFKVKAMKRKKDKKRTLL
jgi:hypothetical protein